MWPLLAGPPHGEPEVPTPKCINATAFTRGSGPNSQIEVVGRMEDEAWDVSNFGVEV